MQTEVWTAWYLETQEQGVAPGVPAEPVLSSSLQLAPVPGEQASQSHTPQVWKPEQKWAEISEEQLKLWLFGQSQKEPFHTAELVLVKAMKKGKKLIRFITSFRTSNSMPISISLTTIEPFL